MDGHGSLYLALDLAEVLGSLDLFVQLGLELLGCLNDVVREHRVDVRHFDFQLGLIKGFLGLLEFLFVVLEDILVSVG